MKVIICSSYEMVSVKASQIVSSHVREKPDSVFGLATGGTPLRMYELLAEDHRLNGTSYQKTVSFNLDEYGGLNRSHPNSYHYYMQSHFFSKVDLLPANRFVPDGLASDLQEECEQYEKQIKGAGGIDLQILGLGENGHIGFNEQEPPSKKGRMSQRSPMIQEKRMPAFLRINEKFLIMLLRWDFTQLFRRKKLSF